MIVVDIDDDNDIVVVVVVVAVVAVSVVGYLAVVTEPSAVGWWWNTAPRHTHPI